MTFGCSASFIIASSGNSTPVLDGTLYNITGMVEASATYKG